MLKFEFHLVFRMIFIWTVQTSLFLPACLAQKIRPVSSFELDKELSRKVDATKRTEDCNVDINCIEGQLWQKEKRSVLKLLILNDTISKLCTCTLLNNSARDKKPYVITAQHCIASQKEADSSIFIFSFESLGCNKEYNPEFYELRGATLLATSYEHDYALLELNQSLPTSFNPYYSGWDVSDSYLSNVTAIHHPWGFPKKISRFYGQISKSDFEDSTFRSKDGFWNISHWDRGTTDNGSSGAPLFNANHLLIGTLTGGNAECGFPYNDYFSRFSLAFNYDLKKWLDPVGTGVQALEGLDGGKEIVPTGSDKLVVYPNPTCLSTIIINFPFDPSEAIQIILTDIFAKKHIVDFQSVDSKAELNLSGLPNGLYSINVVYRDKSFSSKFIKSSF